MAKAYITEFSQVGADNIGAQFYGLWPAVAEQTVAIGTVTSSSAFNAQTRFIRVHVDAICSIEIGAAPTATTSTARLAANTTEYFAVAPGHKISVITNT
jgi:hypothetical protein